jgi:hypothetical protein
LSPYIDYRVLLTSFAKSYRAPLWFRRRYQAAESLKNFFELSIVFLFQSLNLSRKVGVGSEHLPQVNKSPHYLNIHLNGSLTSQDAGQHGDTLLGKDVGQILAMLPTAFL